MSRSHESKRGRVDAAAHRRRRSLPSLRQTHANERVYNTYTHVQPCFFLLHITHFDMENERLDVVFVVAVVRRSPFGRRALCDKGVVKSHSSWPFRGNLRLADDGMRE